MLNHSPLQEFEVAASYILETMTFAELQNFRNEIESVLRRRKQEDLEQAVDAAEQAAGKYDFSLKDLLEGFTKPRPGKVIPKYRNPRYPRQTWAGRGRRPAWFQDAVAAGTDPLDMEIQHRRF